jgi:hypothetical protein
MKMEYGAYPRVKKPLSQKAREKNAKKCRKILINS